MNRCGYEIDELNLSIRVYNVLLCAGIKTISNLKKLDDEELGKIKNLSSKGIAEIREKLKAYKDTSTNGWISVKDMPPTEESANEIGSIIAILVEEGFPKAWCWDIVVEYPSEFSYWMPFPEPPKGE